MERDLWVHDKIILEALIEVTDEAALTLKETMEKNGRALLKIIPIEAEMVVANSSAEK
jgi:DNA polymerase I-like protein with 3'-5' exonuclease and polymerase domains